MSREEAEIFLKHFHIKQKRLLQTPEAAEKSSNDAAAQRDMLVRLLTVPFVLQNHVDSEYYLQKYKDVAENGISAVDHYIRYGWREGRQPNPQFDAEFYASQYPEGSLRDINPLAHYILIGRREGKFQNRNEMAEKGNGE